MINLKDKIVEDPKLYYPDTVLRLRVWAQLNIVEDLLYFYGDKICEVFKNP